MIGLEQLSIEIGTSDVREIRLSVSSHLGVSIVLLALMASFAIADDEEVPDIAKRLEASAIVLTEVMSTPKKTIPSEVLAEAKCVAVVPSLVKIALGIGGRHGKGVVTCHTKSGWSAPGPISISGGSIGLQIGTQAVDLILVFLDQNALQELLSTKFRIGAEVAGTPGPIGNQSATGDWHKAEILTYSKARGVFAGVTLKGAAVKQDKDGIVELYGRYIPIGSIVAGRVSPPRESDHFLATLRKYMPDAQHPQG
jgi:lipid-binding SYLF domain-containing protein